MMARLNFIRMLEFSKSVRNMRRDLHGLEFRYSTSELQGFYSINKNEYRTAFEQFTFIYGKMLSSL